MRTAGFGLALMLVLPAAFGGQTPVATPDELVILIHGHGRTGRSMERLGDRLTEAGYSVLNFEYASRRKPFDALVDDLDRAVQACCADRRERIHFVTYSLGGILVRGYLAGRASGYQGRVVMLSPPNHGSEVVDVLGDWPLVRAWLGPTGRRLGTAPDSIPNQLGPPEFELGIITGTRSIAPLGSALIPGDDDGRVSIASASLDGARDFMTVPRTHTFIMNSADVARQCVHFLRHGSFARDVAATDAAQPALTDPG
ncbi:MAG: esterase/lipase family protein [Gammaproteobacteria bacterium]